MALIKSISGIRGTIGGVPGKNLTPIDVVKFTTAYGAWVAQQGNNKKIVVSPFATKSNSTKAILIVKAKSVVIIPTEFDNKSILRYNTFIE